VFDGTSKTNYIKFDTQLQIVSTNDIYFIPADAVILDSDKKLVFDGTSKTNYIMSDVDLHINLTNTLKITTESSSKPILELSNGNFTNNDRVVNKIYLLKTNGLNTITTESLPNSTILLVRADIIGFDTSSSENITTTNQYSLAVNGSVSILNESQIYENADNGWSIGTSTINDTIIFTLSVPETSSIQNTSWMVKLEILGITNI
jgi:hypothetical protein